MKTFIGPIPSKSHLQRLLLTMLDDSFTEVFDPELKRKDDWHDELDDLLRDLRRFWCKTEGHEIIHDSCGIPDHDYCVMCDDLFPGQA